MQYLTCSFLRLLRNRNILALPVRLAGLGLGNPCLEARREYASSVKESNNWKPLVEQIVSQSHQLPEDSLTKLAQQEVRRERLKALEHRAEGIKDMAPRKTQRALDLATEKGSSAWLTVLPHQDCYYMAKRRNFFAEVAREIHCLEDVFILPTRATNQNTGLASSCPLARAQPYNERDYL